MKLHAIESHYAEKEQSATEEYCHRQGQNPSDQDFAYGRELHSGFIGPHRPRDTR